MATSISLWSDEEYVNGQPGISDTFTHDSRIVVHLGDAYNFLCTLPSSSVHLIITSPPYNVGKAYEVRAEVQEYLQVQEKVIDELVRVLNSCGSICWQVGNYVKAGHHAASDGIEQNADLKKIHRGWGQDGIAVYIGSVGCNFPIPSLQDRGASCTRQVRNL